MTTSKNRVGAEREWAAGLVPEASMGGELGVIGSRLVAQAGAEGIALTGADGRSDLGNASTYAPSAESGARHVTGSNSG